MTKNCIKCGKPLPQRDDIEYEECSDCYWGKPEHEWLNKGKVIS